MLHWAENHFFGNLSHALATSGAFVLDRLSLNLVCLDHCHPKDEELRILALGLNIPGFPNCPLMVAVATANAHRACCKYRAALAPDLTALVPDWTAIVPEHLMAAIASAA